MTTIDWRDGGGLDMDFGDREDGLFIIPAPVPGNSLRGRRCPKRDGRAWTIDDRPRVRVALGDRCEADGWGAVDGTNRLSTLSQRVPQIGGSSPNC